MTISSAPRVCTLVLFHLICSNCNVCIHMFSCSCTDVLIHGTICKHIHLVIRAEGKKMTPCSTITNEKGSIPREIILKNVQNKSKLSKLSQTKQHFLSKLSEIALGIHALDDSESLSEIGKHINSCLGLLSILPPARQPENKHLTKERSFYSTKRKRRPRTRIAKPTDLEREKAIYNLLNKGNGSFTCNSSLLSMFIQRTVHIIIV